MKNGKILWADDEIDLLKPHILFLQQKGYEVTTVSNGRDALEKAAHETFDLIILDENMPGLSGLDTLGQIKMENPETIDGLILDQDIREMYRAFDRCLTDPEKQVISMRYGLFRGREHTQREIAARMGISRSYVSRIEKRAIGKLRAEFEHF